MYRLGVCAQQRPINTPHCELLSLPRSSVYYRSSNQDVHAADLRNEIREIYERHPFEGYKRITDDLRDKGCSSDS